MGRLDGKVCVITGAGGGMGREAAIVFSEEGASVCAADVNLAAAEETVAACRDAFAQQVDVADEASVKAMMDATAERYGGIDVLYNNAGISPADDASVLDTSVESWDRVQAVNTRGVFLCCKHGIPHLQRRGGGSVINVASFVAIVGAATSQISYTASKGAVLAMSRELAVQFARENIRVNALCPGPVETPLLLRIFGDDPAALERRRIHWPTGRLAKPREVVNGALFLASDESSYVNGSTFLVDGGLTASYVTPRVADAHLPHDRGAGRRHVGAVARTGARRRERRPRRPLPLRPLPLDRARRPRRLPRRLGDARRARRPHRAHPARHDGLARHLQAGVGAREERRHRRPHLAAAGSSSGSAPAGTSRSTTPTASRS